MKNIVYQGLILLKDHGEAMDVLFIGDMEDPFAEDFPDGELVSVRYWISNVQMNKRELQEAATKTMMGIADSLYEARYSEITGYLWTDEEVKIGGHDLLAELLHYVGKFVYLEVDIHEKSPT